MNQPPPTIVAGGTPAPAIPPPRRSFHGLRGKMPPRCQIERTRMPVAAF